MKRVKIIATILNDNRPCVDIEPVGCVAWTAYQLVKSGPRGCTPVEQPAPRWSDYVFRLRGLGIVIETIAEPHTGDYSGTHARYVLRSRSTLRGAKIREWRGNDTISGGNPKPANIDDNQGAAA